MCDEISCPFPNFNGATPLKFENGWIILSHTLLGMWLAIQAGIKVNPSYKKAPSYDNEGQEMTMVAVAMNL